MLHLTPLEQGHVTTLFNNEDHIEAERLLVEECWDVPLVDSKPGLLERVRVAAIKVSDGNLTKLREAIDLAQVDWRDLLVSAGFADDTRAHERWIPRR